MARAMDIADYIILKAKELNKPVSNLNLQKIMYFLNVEYLLEKNENLITDKQFEKWSYGPVIRQVYSQYSCYGSEEINEVPTYTYLVREKDQYEVKNYDFNRKDFEKRNTEITKFIADNIESFLEYEPYELVGRTHMDPQWKDKTTPYDNQKTIDYYRKNKFW